MVILTEYLISVCIFEFLSVLYTNDMFYNQKYRSENCKYTFV